MGLRSIFKRATKLFTKSKEKTSPQTSICDSDDSGLPTPARVVPVPSTHITEERVPLPPTVLRKRLARRPERIVVRPTGAALLRTTKTKNANHVTPLSNNPQNQEEHELTKTPTNGKTTDVTEKIVNTPVLHHEENTSNDGAEETTLIESSRRYDTTPSTQLTTVVNSLSEASGITTEDDLDFFIPTLQTSIPPTRVHAWWQSTTTNYVNSPIYINIEAPIELQYPLTTPSNASTNALVIRGRTNFEAADIESRTEVAPAQKPQALKENQCRTPLRQMVQSYARGSRTIRDLSRVVSQYEHLQQNSDVHIQGLRDSLAHALQLNSAMQQNASLIQENIGRLEYELEQRSQALLQVEEGYDIVFQENQQLHGRLMMAQEHVASFGETLGNIEAAKAELVQENDRLHEELDCVKEEKEFAEWNANKWERDCKDAEEEKETLEETVAEFEQELEYSTAHRDSLQAKVDQARAEEAARVPSALERKLDEKRRQIYTLQENNALIRAHFDKQVRITIQTESELEDIKRKNDLLEQHNEQIIIDRRAKFLEDETRPFEEPYCVAPGSLEDSERCVLQLQADLEKSSAVNRELSRVNAVLEEELATTKAELGVYQDAAADDQSCNSIWASCNNSPTSTGSADSALPKPCAHAFRAVVANRTVLTTKQELNEQTSGLKLELAELTKCYEEVSLNFMNEHANTVCLEHKLEELKKDRDYWHEEVKHLEEQLQYRAFGADQNIMMRKHDAETTTLNEHIWTLRVQVRDLEMTIETTAQELGMARYEFEQLRQSSSGLKISEMRMEAVVQAIEARFHNELRKKKLVVDLAAAEETLRYIGTGEESLDQMQLRELRRLDPGMYRLKDGEVTSEPLPDYIF